MYFVQLAIAKDVYSPSKSFNYALFFRRRSIKLSSSIPLKSRAENAFVTKAHLIFHDSHHPPHLITLTTPIIHYKETGQSTLPVLYGCGIPVTELLSRPFRSRTAVLNLLSAFLLPAD